jgi:hypothetical protein
MELIFVAQDSPSPIRLTRDSIRQCTTGAFAVAEFAHGCRQIGGGKVGPPFLQKHELRKGAFPQQKIGKSLFAACANQQINLGRAAAVNFRKHCAEGFR